MPILLSLSFLTMGSLFRSRAALEYLKLMRSCLEFQANVSRRVNLQS
jgi:hypothetical protein